MKAPSPHPRTISLNLLVLGQQGTRTEKAEEQAGSSGVLVPVEAPFLGDLE